MIRLVVGSFVLFLLLTGSVLGQTFDTVINLPGDVLPPFIGSNTQVNLFDGELNSSQVFEVGSRDEVVTNAELNVFGGQVVSSVVALDGTRVNVSGGTLRESLYIHDGSTASISGGNIATGSFEFFLVGLGNEPGAGADVTLSGGAFTDRISVFEDNSIKLIGAEFEVDGMPVVGLGAPGDTAALDVAPGALLSGVFADGTPFAFNGGNFADGTLSLEVASLPLIGPATISTSTDLVPLGIRQGQTLNVDGVGVVANFNAGRGSVVNVIDGVVGRNLEAVGATVNILGGIVQSDFTAPRDSTVNFSGGSVGRFRAGSGTVVNFSGTARADAEFVLGDGSTAEVSGGRVGRDFITESGSDVTFVGGEFRLNGELISGLEQPGNTVVVPLTADDVLTGTLADGTPFGQTGEQFTLRAANVPAVGPSMITASVDAVPPTLRNGQTLLVDDGGVVPDDVIAGFGTIVNVEPGGTIERSFHVLGGEMNISGGTISSELFADHRSRINITGGELGRHASGAYFRNSMVTVAGGSVGGRTVFEDGTILLVTGGSIGDDSRLRGGSQAIIRGGQFSDFLIEGEGTTARFVSANLERGRFRARDRSKLFVEGGEYGFTSFTVSNGSTLEVAGGATVSSIWAGDNRSMETSTIDIYDATIDRAQAGNFGVINLHSGDIDFVEIEGGVFNMHSGTVGTLSLDFGEFNLEDGTVGSPVRLSAASVFNMHGGRLESSVELRGGSRFGPGAIANISGGVIAGELSVQGGYDTQEVANVSGGIIQMGASLMNDAVLNFSGGKIEQRLHVDEESIINMSGGVLDLDEGFASVFGTLNLFGTQFFIGDVDITDTLMSGEKLIVDDRNVVLSGVLADGSPFRFGLSAPNVGRVRPLFIPPRALVTITLVPEPTTQVLMLLVGAIFVSGSRRDAYLRSRRERC